MSKRIAYCADGTWDTSSKHTNVYKLYKSLTVSADQMPFYDDGVGSMGLAIEKLVGGAFGTGLWQKIKDGYTRIAHVYEQDDQVYIFGFSRGAYTARSVAGMIAACGLPTKNFSNDLVDTAFNAYRDKANRAQLLGKLKDCAMYNAKITMVGVWETVGALGIPSVFGGVDPVLYGFLDTSLHPNVLNAYHALAIDERRFEFPATLWSAPAPGQTMEQVWFCGAHSDVGGGEPDDVDGSTALSDITLSWMMSKASALGLQIAPDAQKAYALPLDAKYALDKLHESWTPLWGFPRRRSIEKGAVLADSVIIRSQHDNTWRPENLEFTGGILSSNYRIARVMSQPQVAASAAAEGSAG
ncbi:MAG TPA: DUF2235 domain-containing protein [Bryobacteraceae bacterium]|nr:DUF2235 domain-containing protein [Bryobacteraceae bacterium]